MEQQYRSNIETIKLPSKEEYLTLIGIDTNKIIETSKIKLINKYEIILKYNQYIINKNISSYSKLLEDIKNGKILDFKQYVKKNKTISTEIDILPSDIHSIKNCIETYNANNSNKKIDLYLNSNKIFTKEIKMTLKYLNTIFMNDIHSIVKNAESISSVKIFDFYQDIEDKNEFIKPLSDVLNKYLDYSNCDIVSIINSLNMHIFLENLIEDKFCKIKYMKNSSFFSYISSVFFILISYKIKNSNNYCQYIMYIEPDTNTAILKFVKDDFAKDFYKLLYYRFEKHFNSKTNIDFIETIKNKEETFSESLDKIYVNMEELLHESIKKINQLKEKNSKLLLSVSKLKLQYPKMDNSYKFLNNIVYSITILKEIEYAHKNNFKLNNTIEVIKKTLAKQIYQEIGNRIISIKNQYDINKDVDIFKLRKSIYINKIANTEKAFIDIFPMFDWKNIYEILDRIKQDEDKLNKFFMLFKVDLKEKNLFWKQKKFQLIIDNYIVKGKEIKI